MLRPSWLLVALLVMGAGCGRNLDDHHRTVVGLDISGNVAADTPSGLRPVAAGDQKQRDVVCPGHEIPAPGPGAGPQRLQGPPRPLAR